MHTISEDPAQTTPSTDAAAFVEFVRPHWPQLDRLARRLAGPQLAEDVVQEALAAAWRSRRRFDASRGSARSWLLAIVANEARRARAAPVEHEVPEVAVADGAAARGEALDVGVALRQLPHRQSVAVALFYYLDLPVDQCAEVMGCSAGTVKSTLSDARRRLQSILGEEYR